VTHSALRDAFKRFSPKAAMNDVWSGIKETLVSLVSVFVRLHCSFVDHSGVALETLAKL